MAVNLNWVKLKIGGKFELGRSKNGGDVKYDN
jgi:hypothetical protein